MLEGLAILPPQEAVNEEDKVALEGVIMEFINKKNMCSSQILKATSLFKKYSKAQEVFNQIIQDENKHVEMLQELYSEIFS